MQAVELPVGSAPAPVSCPHFPDRLHAYVWRNWELVPAERLAQVVGATRDQILELGRSMGLPDPPPITEDQQRRSYITVIRRNWHLLPYEQLLTLLGWTPEQLAYTLREDDFFFIKLGQLKPRCEPIKYASPTAEVKAREAQLAAWVREAFPEGLGKIQDPLFGFVARLSQAPAEKKTDASASAPSVFTPRYCSSYFTLYGDPLLDTKADSYPDGYLAQLAAVGVDGIWLQAVLYKLTPFPWDKSLSAHYEERLANLRALVARARKHGMGIYLYLNEPRAMPLAFYQDHPDLQGVGEGDWAALCTSAPEVQNYIRDAVALICREVPDLAGFFTITASENLTNCWSHHSGAGCPRCGKRSPDEVIAEVNTVIRDGIAKVNGKATLFAWDWGWKDEWAQGIINRLPKDVALMSVSEWSIPIERGGVKTTTGEYSISTIGPGPRATRHWAWARERGLKTMAKIQAANTWEMSIVPYVPALENVAQHAFNLRKANVNGLMLGWTLGGWPSPNLEVVAEMSRPEERSVDEVLSLVAERRFGKDLAPAVVKAWKAFSVAFSEFPFDGSLLYNAPQHMGPANPLWERATGYHATMTGIPYDDLTSWRGCYPPDVFIGQFEKMAGGFLEALRALRAETANVVATDAQARAFSSELDVATVCQIHFQTVANQARFVLARDALAAAATADQAREPIETIESTLHHEIQLVDRLYGIQRRDSRIGFEATNHYFYVPLDLAEKVLNCQDLLTRWLPAERARVGL